MDKIHLYDKIVSPLVTEKSTNLSYIDLPIPGKSLICSGAVISSFILLTVSRAFV